MRPSAALSLVALAASLAACGPLVLEEPLPDQARERGLRYVNASGGPEKRVVLEANGAGVALLDLEDDGDLDVVFAQGLASFDALVDGPGADLATYANDGTGRFRRGRPSGLSGWWTGLASGDVDGDGDADLVAGGFGDVAVLLQEDDGRLVRLEASGVEPAPELRWIVGASNGSRAPAWATSLALFDADGDGALDLYVGRYLELDPRDPPLGALGEGALALPCRWKGHEVFCGPRGLVAQADRVYRGLGDGRFEDATARWLPDAGDAPGYTLGVRPLDADGDGDTDLYVACDSSPNRLYENRLREDGRFVDRAFGAGVALSMDGRPEAGMGLDAGDVDRDGRLDLVVTNFSDEPTALYLGRAGATPGTWRFEHGAFRYGLGRDTRRLLSWGVHLVDLDGDGWLELFTGNGHVYPQADLTGTGTSYGQPDTLWRLGPDPRATSVPPASELSVLAPVSGTRGSAVGDIDGDGAPDLVLVRIDGPAALGMNRFAESGPDNKRLLVRCLGPESFEGAGGRRTPRDGIGTRVVLTAGRATLLREVHTAAGFQSASSPWLHFGLGKRSTYDGLVVRWPSGREERLPGGRANRRMWIREGEGVVREEPLP